MTGRAFLRSKTEAEADERRGFGRGATLERSESVVGQNIGPAFWVCRAKSGAAFRCAKPPCAVVRFAAMASPPRTAVLPFLSRLRRAGSPTAKTRRLLPFGRISLAAKPRWPVIALAGGNVLATPPSSACCGLVLAPRRLLPFSRISPAAKTAGAQNAPRPGWVCFG